MRLSLPAAVVVAVHAVALTLAGTAPVARVAGAVVLFLLAAGWCVRHRPGRRRAVAVLTPDPAPATASVVT